MLLQLLPYFAVFLGTVGLVCLCLSLYSRRERRRQWAMNVALRLQQQGLVDSADVLFSYAVGDYRGLVGGLRRMSDENILRVSETLQPDAQKQCKTPAAQLQVMIDSETRRRAIWRGSPRKE